MTEDEKMQVAVFRFSVIGDFVTATAMSRAEKRRLMRDKCARKWQIPFSEKTRISKGTIQRWCRIYRDSRGNLKLLYPKDRSDQGKARVAEGSIYDYFKNKEDLLNSVAERKFQEHLKKLPQIFNISSSERKLRRLMRYHFTLYCTNRRFLHVFLTQILYNINFYRSRAYNSFATYLDYLEETVEGGKADGSFRKDVNTRIFRNMFLGAFSHMTIRWLLVEKNKEYDRMREIDRIIDLLLAALRPVQSEESISS